RRVADGHGRVLRLVSHLRSRIANIWSIRGSLRASHGGSGRRKRERRPLTRGARVRHLSSSLNGWPSEVAGDGRASTFVPTGGPSSSSTEPPRSAPTSTR